MYSSHYKFRKEINIINKFKGILYGGSIEGNHLYNIFVIDNISISTKYNKKKIYNYI